MYVVETLIVMIFPSPWTFCFHTLFLGSLFSQRRFWVMMPWWFLWLCQCCLYGAAEGFLRQWTVSAFRGSRVSLAARWPGSRSLRAAGPGSRCFSTRRQRSAPRCTLIERLLRATEALRVSAGRVEQSVGFTLLSVGSFHRFLFYVVVFCFLTFTVLCWFQSYNNVRVSEWKLLGSVWLFATPWTVQSTVSRLDTGVGSLALLQWIFPTQGWSSGLPHCRWVFTIWAAGEAQDKVNQPEPHVHPLPPASLPPHPAPVPARIITDASLGSCAGAASHQRWAHPWQRVCLDAASLLCPTLSSPTVSTSPRSTSASPVLPCKQVDQDCFSRFHTLIH